jgi:hypothetical protein
LSTKQNVVRFSHDDRLSLYEAAERAAGTRNSFGETNSRGRPWTAGDVIALWATLGRRAEAGLANGREHGVCFAKRSAEARRAITSLLKAMRGAVVRLRLAIERELPRDAAAELSNLAVSIDSLERVSPGASAMAYQAGYRAGSNINEK